MIAKVVLADKPIILYIRKKKPSSFGDLYSIFLNKLI